MADTSTPSYTPRSRWLDRTTPPHIITLVLIAGIGALNMNIFLPSLPSMATWFMADYATVSLAISAYMGATALLQIFIGPLSDRYGRRPVMLVSIGVFVLATVGCLLAQSIETFLAFRFLQAVIATGMVLSRAVVRDMVGPDRAASMIGYVTMGTAVVPMIGPTLGGQLDLYFGWHGSVAFLIMAGVAMYALVWADMGETNHTPSASFGAQFRAYPELLTSRRFWGYALVAAFASGTFFTLLGGGPFVATVILGLNAAEFGLYFALIAVGYMGGNFLSGRFAARVGLDRMMVIGGCTAAAGTIIAIVLFGAGFLHPIVLFGPMVLVGMGNGLTLPSANAGMVSVRPHLSGSASGLGGALMIGGGAALAAIAGALLSVESGVWPLLLIMLATALLSVLCAIYVIRRSRKVAPLPAE